MTSDRDPNHLRFACLPPAEQRTTIARLAAMRWDSGAIARLTGLAPGDVRRLLEESVCSPSA